MSYATKEERAAYRAGCLAVERRIAAVMENKPEDFLAKSALEDLWAKLGAQDQGGAIQAIKHMKAEIDGLKTGSDIEREAWSVERQKMQAHIRIQRESANADFNSLSDRLSTANYNLSAAQRRINELVGELNASRKMGVHFRKERDTLDDFITDMKADKSNPIFQAGYNAGLKDGKAERGEPTYSSVGGHTDKIEQCANLGIATTAQLLDELKARAEVGGYSKYRTVDTK